MRAAADVPLAAIARAVLAFCVAAFGATACDPCGLTFGCSRPPVAAVVGQIVDQINGNPMAGVRVDLTRQSGVTLQPATEATTTSANGMFTFELPATSVGDAFVTIGVATPNRRPYTVPDVRLRASTSGGSATVLPPWVAEGPTVPFILVLYRDRDKEDGVPNARAVFRRTAGPAMISPSGAIVDSVAGTTNGVGWLYLFQSIVTDRAGVLTGDLVLRSPTTSDSLVIRDITWNAEVRYEQTFGFTVIVVGSL